MTKLTNNGLPNGLRFKDIGLGDLLLVFWDDSKPLLTIVTQCYDDHRRRDYAGPVSFRGTSRNGHDSTFDGQQVIAKLASRYTLMNMGLSYHLAKNNTSVSALEADYLARQLTT